MIWGDGSRYRRGCGERLGTKMLFVGGGVLRMLGNGDARLEIGAGIMRRPWDQGFG